MEEALKQAIDEDDAQQLYEVLQQHAKGGRTDVILDNLYDKLRGRSRLHRYPRNKVVVCVETFTSLSMTCFSI